MMRTLVDWAAFYGSRLFAARRSVRYDARARSHPILILVALQYISLY